MHTFLEVQHTNTTLVHQSKSVDSCVVTERMVVPAARQLSHGLSSPCPIPPFTFDVSSFTQSALFQKTIGALPRPALSPSPGAPRVNPKGARCHRRQMQSQGATGGSQQFCQPSLGVPSTICWLFLPTLSDEAPRSSTNLP